MKRRMSTGRIRRRIRHRAEVFRQRQQDVAQTCPTCRKAAWPTRAAAKERMRQVTSRPDYVPPPIGRPSVYECPSGSGWHWGHDKFGNEQVS